jgi:methylase of polypeptide subunit release factors
MLDPHALPPSFYNVDPRIYRSHEAFVDALLHRSDAFWIEGIPFWVDEGVYKPALTSTSLLLWKAIEEEALSVGLSGPAWIEVGTGSGVISLLAKHHGYAQEMWLTDIDPKAVACARRNLGHLSACAQKGVHFHCGALFEGLPVAHRADTVVFNLPLLHCQRPVSTFERPLADEGGQCAQRFFEEALSVITPTGCIWVTWSSLCDPAVLTAALRAWDFTLKALDYQPTLRHTRLVLQGRPKRGLAAF